MTNKYLLFISYFIILLFVFSIIYILRRLINLHSILKRHNIILICDCDSTNVYKIIRYFNFNIFDINDDVSIINHFIHNPFTEEILLDTNGGYISSNDRLVNFILDSELKLKIYVMRKAYSAGTVLALTSDTLYMDKNSCLGPTDPQITILTDTISIKSLIKMCEEKDKNNISDLYLIQYYESKRSHEENINLITKLLNKKFHSKISKKDQLILIEKITSGDISHHIPISYNLLNKYIKINNNIPYHIKKIYDLYYIIFHGIFI